jgi:hypothetical protein
LNDGDVVMYCDSGACFVADVEPLLSLTDEQDIVLFDFPYFFNRNWIKRDCFELMGCTDEKYIQGAHWNGAFQIYKKTPKSIAFVEEYLKYCCDERILTDIPSESGAEDNSFKDHRHDQAVLSLLAIKHEIKPNLDPSQYGRPYNNIINHHRISK